MHSSYQLGLELIASVVEPQQGRGYRLSYMSGAYRRQGLFRRVSEQATGIEKLHIIVSKMLRMFAPLLFHTTKLSIDWRISSGSSGSFCCWCAMFATVADGCNFIALC